MNLADQEFEATAEQYRFLASKQINATDLHKYVKIVLDVHQQEEDELSTRTKNIIGKVEEFFLLGKGNDLPGVNGTYWAAYNGVTEYLSYVAGNNNDNRNNRNHNNNRSCNNNIKNNYVNINSLRRNNKNRNHININIGLNNNTSVRHNNIIVLIVLIST